MAAYLEGDYYPNLKGTAAIQQFLRVKDAATWGEVEIAGDEAFLGEAKFSTAKAGESVSVRDRRAMGYHAYVAAGAIAEGADVFTAAAGKVDDAGAVLIGKAVNAVGAADQIVYVRPA